MMSYAPAYFAGTSDVSAATTVSVGAGEERTGVDFSVQIVPAARVEGVVSRSDGQSVQGVQLFLFAELASQLTRAPREPLLQSRRCRRRRQVHVPLGAARSVHA